jgi:hypothetical protein
MPQSVLLKLKTMRKKKRLTKLLLLFYPKHEFQQMKAEVELKVKRLAH